MDSGPTGVVTMGLQSESTASMPKPPQMTPVEAAAWYASADSVMQVHLQRHRFSSPDGYAANMGECHGDSGADSPPTGIALGRARILSRDTVSVDWAWDYQGTDTIPGRTTTYTVEVTTAARMIPNWVAGVAYRNDSISADEAYVMEVGPQVDTVRIFLEHVLSPTPHWAVCGPTHRPDEPGGFWTFVREARPWPRAILWRPANASWSRIRQLADSLGAG
jgi:hypothetical protein